MSAIGVPGFSVYYPTAAMLDAEQASFYRYLKGALDRGEAPEVADQVSYLYLYTYDVLASASSHGPGAARVQLESLAARYRHHGGFERSCREWAADCLLVGGEYETYLDRTEAPLPFGSNGYRADRRLNIQHHLEREADAVDLFTNSEGYVTDFTKNQAGRFRELLYQESESCVIRDGPWFDRLIAQMGPSSNIYEISLFNGAVVPRNPRVPFKSYCFYSAPSYSSWMRDVGRAAENRLRQEAGVPLVGEGWIAETALYRVMASTFFETSVVQHGRPSWLGRQHFDIWFPEWKIAVEYQGMQHFEAVEYFGGAKSLADTIERDQRKADLARENGVFLVLALPSHEPRDVVAVIREHRESLSRLG